MAARYSGQGMDPGSLLKDNMLLGCFKPQKCDNLLGREQERGNSGNQNNSLVPSEQSQPQYQPPELLQEFWA